MKRHKVINTRDLPTRLPIPSTIIYALLLDRLHAPGWIWVVWALWMCIIWAGSIALFAAQDEISLEELK